MNTNICLTWQIFLNSWPFQGLSMDRISFVLVIRPIGFSNEREQDYTAPALFKCLRPVNKLASSPVHAMCVQIFSPSIQFVSES